MILTTEQIKNIITTNPNRDIINRGVKYNREMRMHLYGEGLAWEMEQITDYETASLADLRVKYARSNKDLFARLKRPIDKVFSSRGGSTYYNLADAAAKKARMMESDISGGYSIKKWTEMFWTPHLLDDPFGMVFMEVLPEREARVAQMWGRSVAYPTYKAITSVYDYQTNGCYVDYVVFRVSASEKKAAGLNERDIVFRVVDDAMDYYVLLLDNEIKILSNLSFANLFGRVPALLNSGIPDPQHEGCVVSFFDDVKELAKHYLLKGAIKVTHEFLHAFPKYWQYVEGCNDCNGMGYDATRDDKVCQSCKGTGKKFATRVSDMLGLEMPQTANDPIVAPHVAGYVSPDKTFYEIATSDLKTLEEVMFATIWGYQPKVPGGNQSVTQLQQKTATEVLNESKPQADRLQVISEMAEKIHKFILDGMVIINITPNYDGSSVNYGRRYMVEGPDEIWRKYSEARTSGAPVSVLEDFLIEFYEAKYSSDKRALKVALNLMYVEPFVHHSVEEVRSFMPSEDMWKAKLYFSEWLKGQSEWDLLRKEVPELQSSLMQFVGGMTAISLEPPKQLNAA